MSTPPQSQRLAGKVAIVTGSGSGYGAGIARRFCQEGCKVIIADFNEPNGLRVAEEIGLSAAFFKTDVTKREEWEKLVEFTVGKFGAVDVLVNNAGTSYKNKPTLDVTEAEFDACFNVNVRSIFHSIHTVVPSMISSGKGGSVINIASIGATRPRPGLVWYNASKGAVWNATKGLASEYGQHSIRVNSVCPLLGATGLFEQFTGVEATEENIKSFVGVVPLGRLCTPEDVASACLFFASDDARFVTGINMEVDGGKGI